ncbi:FMN-binding glutamate synthase family protein [Halobacteriovorax marinus]|uniref:FMN-binding glutamate synthase family protein n=1 Tax=Halobacteriovorax marinus TaxID=97084 RepID=A0A1Y5FFN0_9BACT|nr:FMN-binding glutamate synthase family protein [Halobacteriovorax marinus]
MRKHFYIACIVSIIIELILFKYVLLGFYLTAPIVIILIYLGMVDSLQNKQTIRKNYPLGGRLRYVMEELRPKIYQYFIESDIDGTPIDRTKRSVIYQRAKKSLATKPFGTQEDVYAIGYEWINHSMYPLNVEEILKVSKSITVGGKDCKHPYDCSRLNISAMSFGSLSGHAIEALNMGAKLGGFAHNTGEGSISSHHLKHEGDLIWQIGTGYFGCRTEDGNFSADKFTERAKLDSVKMIEIKLSQGAKPGHGGILPAGKNTEEIGKIRGVKPHTRIDSPPYHKAFTDNVGLLNFIKQLRELSGGKPIGIKLCFGSRTEFHDLCKNMVKLGIAPDFITVDGGEGGTGAAPLEFSNSIGTPLKEGLIKTNNILRSYNLRDELKIFASGKIFTGFDMVKAIALGADSCYSARGMMLALGCIQALICNTNHCPTGITTQNKGLEGGLNVKDKGPRVANFQAETLHSLCEILAASGTAHPCELDRAHIYRRVSMTDVKNYEEIYPRRHVEPEEQEGFTL